MAVATLTTLAVQTAFFESPTAHELFDFAHHELRQTAGFFCLPLKDGPVLLKHLVDHRLLGSMVIAVSGLGKRVATG